MKKVAFARLRRIEEKKVHGPHTHTFSWLNRNKIANIENMIWAWNNDENGNIFLFVRVSGKINAKRTHATNKR